jgi:hypothetical protein
VTARPHLHTLDEIGDGLRARILDCCYAWKLQGQVEQHEFVALNPLRADRHLGSFRIVLEGERQGLIKDFATGESWSPLGFAAALWFGGDMGKAIQWAKGFIGLDGSDPNALAKTKRAIVARQESAEISDQDKRKRGAAHGLYAFAASPIYGRPKGAPEDAPEVLLDTPVYRYLKGRGVDLARFPGKVRALRFHPDLHHVPSCWCKGDYQAPGQHVHYPAMLAPIVSATGEFMGVHRTFLQVHLDGRVTKAPLGKDAKLCLGRYAGGMIRLWKGIKVDPETGVATMKPSFGEQVRRLKHGGKANRLEGEPKIELHMAEGIEDALTVAQRFPELTVAAGVSISNMGGLQLPIVVGKLVLWRDNDPAASQADTGFTKVIRNAQALGVAVKVVRPPAGFKDANEVLLRTMEGAA